MSDTQGYPGWQDAFTATGMFPALSFMIRQAMAGASHVALVVVKGVTANTVSGAPPTVNVQPMVAMVDQTGTAQQHGTIYGIPTFRYQAGTSAFICDPVVDDIGVVVCADRDISSAIANQAPSNPGSFRRFDWSDALYFGGFGSVAPVNSIEVNTSGITVNAMTATVTVNAEHVDVVSNDVNLGATGGQPVARVGDTVVGGVITSGSAKVKAA